MNDHQRTESVLRDILALPRLRQAEALRKANAELPPLVIEEAWNTAFGDDSLYDAFTETTLVHGLYAANTAVIRNHLDQLNEPFCIIEVGGGNGRLWRDVLRPDDHGTLVLVDPVAGVHDVVKSRLPQGVRLVSHVALIQDVMADLPDADIVVMSLMLHHVAGRDAQERRRHGLEGPGKFEILSTFGSKIKPRNGVMMLNEADVYCDLVLDPGDEVLVNNVVDSYVRRTALSVLNDIRYRDVAAELKHRWHAIVRLWCMDQINVAYASRADRDVYELDVARWLVLLDDVGLQLESRRFTDDIGVFVQYVLRA